MVVVAMSKTSMTMTQYDAVSSIALSGDTITITYGVNNTTKTYNRNSYNIFIMAN